MLGLIQIPILHVNRFLNEDKLNRLNFYTWMWLIALKPGNQKLEDVQWPLALILAIRKKVKNWT